jgi:hypothetical protein
MRHTQWEEFIERNMSAKPRIRYTNVLIVTLVYSGIFVLCLHARALITPGHPLQLSVERLRTAWGE